MPLFGDFERTDSSSKRRGERRFEYIDRSAQPIFEKIRQKINQWVADYPEAERTELISRFRSRSDSQFNSAEFELLLHASLTAAGFELVPHPELTSSSSRPDFLCRGVDGSEFYLEAVLASQNVEDRSEQPLIGTTLDALDRTSHRNFFVQIRTDGYPRTQPSGRLLRQSILRWLDSLDPDDVEQKIAAAAANGGRADSDDRFVWVHEGLTITATAWPISAPNRGNATTLVGVQFGQAGWVDSWSPIRDAVKSKGAKYGNMDKPFIVAVNFSGHHLDQMDEVQALYGQELLNISIEDADEPPTYSRATNGAWMGLSGPQYTRVSAAWIFGNLHTYNIARASSTLYLNPWSSRPVPSSFSSLYSTAALVSEHLDRRLGNLLGHSLSLPSAWPE